MESALSRPNPHDGSDLADTGSRLRLTRLARALSQEQLAQASGVSRQAIAGVESGRWAPSLKVALNIARALGASVEELFGGTVPLPPVEAVAVDEVPLSSGQGTRVALASVLGRAIAFPLAHHAAADFGFRPASAVVEDARASRTGKRPGDDSAADPKSGRRDSQRVATRQIAPLSPTVVIAGCDPALPLLAVPLGRLDTPVDLLWWPCGSGRALELLRDGLVHVAGVHHVDPDENEDAGREAREWGSSLAELDAVAVGFARWREGLAIRPQVPHKVHDLAGVANLGLRLVNREPGSEARQLLEEERRRLQVKARDLAGYETAATGHLQVASALAAGLGDVGIVSEPAALAYELTFVPMATERYDLVVRRAALHSPEVQGLLRALRSAWLRPQLQALPAYDASMCGDVFEPVP